MPRLVGGHYGGSAGTAGAGRATPGPRRPAQSAACSEAAHAWKTHGMTPEVAKILARCRQQAARIAGAKGGAAASPVEAAKARLRVRSGSGPGPRSGPAKAAPGATEAEVRARYEDEHLPASVRERAFADLAEMKLAKAVKGERGTDYETWDVRIPKPAGGAHAIEAKVKMKGDKKQLSVHADALLRKAEHIEREPGTEYHTVVFDQRHKFLGGANKDKYSGHEIYYRRGSGPFTVHNMHKVGSLKELHTLIHAKPHELPEAARGEQPRRTPELEAQAAKVADGRARRDTPEKKRARRQASVARRKAAGLPIPQMVMA